MTRDEMNKLWLSASKLGTEGAAHDHFAKLGLSLPENAANMRVEPEGSILALVHGDSGKPCDVLNVTTGKAVLGEVGAVQLYKLTDSFIGVTVGVERAVAAHKQFGFPFWAVADDETLRRFEPPKEAKAVFIVGVKDRDFYGQSVAYGLAYRLSLVGKMCWVELWD